HPARLRKNNSLLFTASFARCGQMWIAEAHECIIKGASEMSASTERSDTLREPRPRLLLVDDHPEVLKALRRFLAPSCDIVGDATSGHAALEAAAELKPDVVVLDVAMPGLN